MIKYCLVILWVFVMFIAQAQNPFKITIQNTTLAASDSILPFWFVANQHGKILACNSFLNLSDLYLGQEYKPKTESGLSYTWGGNFIAAFGESNYYQVNRAFAGLALKGWEIKGGLFYDEIRFAGLSTTNGIIGRSENAQPVPRVCISTQGYKPVPFLQNWLSFKGEYEEGFLVDERYVDGAHLHHKSLYLKIKPALSWDINVGFEHFAMWGGTSQNEKIGEMPGWESYWRYVFAFPGNEDFPEIDQINISGNQMGSYQLEVEKDFSKWTLTFYLSHPWEDNSGFTYQQQVMSSPLFFPVIISNNISVGIRSNRFFAHHIGLSGYLSDYFQWKGLLTYIQHLGTYYAPYEAAQKQMSGLFEV